MTAALETSDSHEAVHPKLREKLEKMEIESPGCVVPFEVYGQLLAVYLHDNDLCAAKFLWKRIPESIKADHPELQKIWSVGMALWERNLPEAYAALNQTWSEGVSSIMKAVKEKTRARFVNLVSQAYSSISLAEFSTYVGLGELEAGELASQQPGWSLDTQNKIIIPAQVEVKETETIPSEQQLQLLTDFVAFLEK